MSRSRGRRSRGSYSLGCSCPDVAGAVLQGREDDVRSAERFGRVGGLETVYRAAGGAPGFDAGGRVLDDQAASGVGAEGGGGREVARGRRLACGYVLGADAYVGH